MNITGPAPTPFPVHVLEEDRKAIRTMQNNLRSMEIQFYITPVIISLSLSIFVFIGAIYLLFKNKSALLEQLVLNFIDPSSRLFVISQSVLKILVASITAIGSFIAIYIITALFSLASFMGSVCCVPEEN